MEIVIIVLLLVIIAFLIWDRLRGQQRLKEQDDALSRMVGEKVAGSLAVFGDVRERLGELTKRTKDIEEVGKSISSLQEALRAPKFRGEFGQLGLEVLLSNCLPGSCYELQHRFHNGEIVDAVVRIGEKGEKLVPIDSKFPFPLTDFERMVSTQSEDERRQLRRQFRYTLKKHIEDVSKYILPDEGTFNFALLYIPAENLYYEIIAPSSQPSEESDIYSYCLQKRVFPVSPNSFYAYLQVIVLGLRGLQVEKFAQEILGQLERIQLDLKDFQGDYELLGRHLANAVRKHAEAGTKLTTLSGKLELLGKEPSAEKLPEGNLETKSGTYEQN